MTDFRLKISDIRTIIAETKKITGKDFSNYSYFSLKRRIEQIYKHSNFTDPVEIVEKIKIDPIFIEKFLFEMYPHQTELFRDPEMWNTLIKNVFPKISKKEQIKIHFPYCTSGDEMYSLIFLLHQAELLENTQIYVSPVSKKNKDFIQKAVYPIKKKESAEKNFETLHTNSKLQDLIIFSDHSYEIRDTFRSKPLFINDFNQEAKYLSEFDIVFMRNSLIYFNFQLHEETLNKITESVKRNGWLVIGVGEKLLGNAEKKFKQIVKTENIFKKNSIS